MSKLPATTPTLKQVKIMLPAALHAQLRQQAAENGLSLAAFLRHLIYQQLALEKKKPSLKRPAKTKRQVNNWELIQQIIR